MQKDEGSKFTKPHRSWLQHQAAASTIELRNIYKIPHQADRNDHL